MTEEELIRKIEGIRVCTSGDQRAPHKPLLILYALADLQHMSVRLMPYTVVKDKLNDLLMEFGRPVKRQSTENPFLRLYNDKIWEIDKKVNISKPSNKDLIKNNVSAGFNTEAYNLLKGNNKLIKSIAELLLGKHFNDTLHDDILTRVGLEFTSISIRKSRNPIFRGKILRVYDNKCAICGFNVKLGNISLAIEAAHIKSHKIGGPDKEENGIALCVMHHKLFDQGAFTLNSSKEILVSKRANGTSGLKDWLMRFDGKKIYLPTNPEYYPNNSYIDWHVREVFKSGVESAQSY